MKVPLSTICVQSMSYSSCDPSSQWMASGLVRSAIFSTQRIRCLFVLSGGADVEAFIRSYCTASAIQLLDSLPEGPNAGVRVSLSLAKQTADSLRALPCALP